MTVDPVGTRVATSGLGRDGERGDVVIDSVALPDRSRGGEPSPLRRIGATFAKRRLGMATVLRFGLTRFAQSNADWHEKAERAEQYGFDVLWTPITSSISNGRTSPSLMGG